MSDVKNTIKVKSFERILPSLTRQAQHAVAEEIIFKSIPVTPLKTGNLRNSYNIADIGGDTILYNSAEYAGVVHQMSLTNNYSEPGTSSKFLESTIEENKEDWLEIIKKTFKRAGL